MCKKCYPGDIMKKKKEENMEDNSRSLQERAGEHWRDCKDKLEDSHMFKHWIAVHHEDEDPPAFEIRVVKYCSLTLDHGDNKDPAQEECIK